MMVWRKELSVLSVAYLIWTFPVPTELHNIDYIFCSVDFPLQTLTLH